MRPVLPTNVHSHQEEAARDRSLLLHQGWREGEAGKRSDGAERGGETMDDTRRHLDAEQEQQREGVETRGGGGP